MILNLQKNRLFIDLSENVASEVLTPTGAVFT